MSNQFQHNRPERNGCPDVPPTPGEVVNHLARAAYTESAIIARTVNTGDDILPDCHFDPMSTKEQRQAYVREVAAPLFEGSPPLMAYLDRSSFRGDNREFDGRVSAHNMHDFLKTYETMQATGHNEWPYTEKNAQYVRDLLDFKYPELTGPNFAGFSAQALCRRAGLTKMSVKSYDDYAVLATAWKQGTSEDNSFRQDVAASNRPNTDVPCTTPPDAPPQKQADVPCDTPKAVPADPPCDAPKPQPPCDVPPPAPPCDVPAKPVSPCDAATKPVDPCGPTDAEIALKARFEKMSTFQEGGSYWRMANRWLHAGMKPGDRDDISNRDVHEITREFLNLKHAHVNDKGLPVPMCHPGDRVPIPEHLVELAARHEKLARALERMMSGAQ